MGHQYIIVIDRQSDWRRFAKSVLDEDGYDVRAFADYDHLIQQGIHEDNKPDLVVMGCANVGLTELSLVNQLQSQEIKVVVFATALPIRFMRLLFLRGVSDVADKIYDAAEIQTVVHKAIGRPNRRSHSNYEIALANRI